MNEQNWTYLSQLVVALKLEGVGGGRIGELVAEVDQHLTDSGADPVDEFGTPHSLASALAQRPGSMRPGWVPPQWAGQLVGLAFLVLLMPIVTLSEWTESTVPFTRFAAIYVAIFYIGTSWLGYFAHRRLDGRSWRALGWRFGLPLAVVAIIVGIALNGDPSDSLIEFPRVPFLVVCAVTIPVAGYVLWRNHDPIRFPDASQHLNPLRRGRLAGRPPVSVS